MRADAALHDDASWSPAQTVIPRSVRLSEAPSYGQPIAVYRPESKGAEAYRALAAELLARDSAGTAATNAPSAPRGLAGVAA